MRIRKINISNFRGIKNLDWNLNPEDNLICLLGHGDSTKSSVFKAIEYALSPKWNLPLTDSDFNDCDPSKEIRIEITIGDLSPSISSDFVANFRYFKDGGFRNLNDKQEGDEKVITIALIIKDDLDPFWGIADSDGNLDEEDKLPQSARKSLNLVRLDKDSKNPFHWKYDSPLLKVLNKEKRQEIKTKLVEIGRSARKDFDIEELPDELKNQAGEIENIARSLAVGHGKFSPNVDIFSANAICLHQGEIPLYMLGDGSQKIASLAIAKYLMKKSTDDEADGGFIVFDEIENSLEPHRLRYIVSSLLRDSEKSKFQTFLTTHSPIATEELGTNGLYVARNKNGVIKVNRIPNDCISAVRSNAECLFSKKIVICEGKTEFGLLKAFGRFWSSEEERKNPPEHLGVVLLDGKGSAMHKYLELFVNMGYECCVFKDNDDPAAKISKKASELGVPVYEYPDGFRTEKIIFSESSKDLQDEIINYFNARKAAPEPDIEKVASYESLIDEIEVKLHDVHRLDDPKSPGMFRNIDRAEELGEMILRHWDKFNNGTSKFKQTIASIENWIYGEKL